MPPSRSATPLFFSSSPLTPLAPSLSPLTPLPSTASSSFSSFLILATPQPATNAHRPARRSRQWTPQVVDLAEVQYGLVTTGIVLAVLALLWLILGCLSWWTDSPRSPPTPTTSGGEESRTSSPGRRSGSFPMRPLPQ